MRALKCTLAAFLTFCLLAVPAFASLPEAGTGAAFYVQDEANVLSSETENQILEYNAFLEQACDSAQVVVVTVNYLDGAADEAAARLISEWGVGSAEQHNGMLLLLVAREARGGITVGDGIDEAFYESFPETYYDDFWDDVDAGDFDSAVQTLTGRLYDWYLDYYGISTGVSGQNSMQYGDIYDVEPAPASQSTGTPILGLLFLLIIAVAIFWLLGAASRFTRMRRWGYSGGFFPIFWFGGGRRYRDWYRRQPPPPPGPGGFGGGPRPGPRPPRTSSFSRPSPPRSGGFGGSRPSSGSSFHGRSSSFHGSGFGGHGGGGFRGRR